MKETVDLRPLKPWLQRGEIMELCTEIGIGKYQAAHIIAGRCQNWSFVEKFLARVERNKALKERVTTFNSK